jgi:hypothetical protein
MQTSGGNVMLNPGQQGMFIKRKIGGSTMDPIMCPFCGGTNLFQEDDVALEMDFEYWTIHHWSCLDCARSFDKIEILPASNKFEEINESTIH